MEQKKIIITLVVFILGILSVLRTTFFLWQSLPPDFEVLYHSSFLLFNFRNPYLLTNQLFTQVNYPPIALLYVGPFLFFPFPMALKLWLITSLISFFLSLVILYKMYPVSYFRLSVFFFLSVVSFPFKFTLGMGQVNLILVLFIVASLYFLEKKNKALPGFFLSIATAIKIFPILLAYPILTKRNFRAIFTVFIFLTIFILIPFIVFGKEINLYYFKHVLFPILNTSFGSVYYNQSITGFFARWGTPYLIEFASRIALFFIYLIVVLKRNKNYFFIFSFTIVTILLLNNFTWQHHLVLLIIPYYFILQEKTTKVISFLTIASYFFVAYNIKNPQVFSSTWHGSLYLSHAFFGTFILWLIFVWRWKSVW